MTPATLNVIDKLEKVLSFIFEKAACYVFLHEQATTQVTEFSGASRNGVIDNFFLVCSGN